MVNGEGMIQTWVFKVEQDGLKRCLMGLVRSWFEGMGRLKAMRVMRVEARLGVLGEVSVEKMGSARWRVLLKLGGSVKKVARFWVEVTVAEVRETGGCDRWWGMFLAWGDGPWMPSAVKT
ncbi:hypothetical protein V6N13_071494 [Hibiscus sabdariffa]